MRSLKELEQGLLKGDSFTDEELKRAHEHYGKVRELLGELGQRWHFAWGEANRLWMMTGDYLTARARRH